ncbi:unnamed protein product [Adineta ricciae]|uniref:Uncharacterized protein n=1 Tax=Adineta ricciae TaxID=249248 RepID=A0A814VC95_ADIRI|nr:unnamed protein product [Adineta ricciae]CAF1188621.1 unnamed protein product [Adineta ricciae]
MAATVYCATNTVFHQHSLTTTRAQFSPVRHRAALPTTSSFVSTSSILPHIDQSLIVNAKISDENNNNNDICEADDQTQHSISADIDRTSLMIDTNDANHDSNDARLDVGDDVDIDEFLSLVGLRSKTKQVTVPNLDLRPLTQRLASPVCLLPLPKHNERVRQALYIRLPFLKFLTTATCNMEIFCSTDATAKAQSLLPRSTAQTRALSSLNRSPKKRKLSKTDFTNMSVDTIRYKCNKMSIMAPTHPAFKCRVVLDRLERSTIEQIMNNPLEAISTSHRSLRQTSPQFQRRLPSITPMQTEKTIVKRKTVTTVLNQSKRLKQTENDGVILHEQTASDTSPSLKYQRVYLKCFLCSKRCYVDAHKTDSDVLHTHWLEHGGNLLLNIYDSEIDSILTRVVEFFRTPKYQLLEGKIKTVFILNSKEIRQSTTKSLSNDSCIVID